MRACSTRHDLALGTLARNGLEELPMRRTTDEAPIRPARRRRRPKRRHEPVPARDVSLIEELDDSLLSGEERAYAEARRVAEEKVQLWGKFWRMAIVVVPLMIFVPWLGFIFLFFGGIEPQGAKGSGSEVGPKPERSHRGAKLLILLPNERS